MDTREKLIELLETPCNYAGCEGDCTQCLADHLIANGVTFATDHNAVEVVHGRWIHCQGKSNLWYCSECGEKILYNPTRRTYNIEKRPVHEVNKYCRGCGAIMDGGNGDGICTKS